MLPSVAIASAAVCTAVLSTIGLGEVPAAAGLATTGYHLLTAGLLAAAYLGAGAGYAGLVCAWLNVPRGTASRGRPPARPLLQTALGALLMLWLSHALGWSGLMSGPRAPMVAMASVGAGWLLLIVQLARAARPRHGAEARAPADFAWLGLLMSAPALGVLLVAACNPPGWLWPSEAGGFDALSYHLPLAMEWAQQGLRPLEHNVYSFLPSYVEAGYLHLDALLGGGGEDRAAGGLLAGEGTGFIACQLLHAHLTVLGGLCVGAAAHRVARRQGASTALATVVGAVAAALVISTPWSVVCGSLAYNEGGVNLGLGAGVLLAVMPGLPRMRRALLVGLLIGLACGCKPTTLMVGGAAPLLVLLARARLRRWPATLLLVGVGGAIALGPPLVRNALATGGNPVFPAGSGVFGSAHWTPEQAARFAAAHSPPGGLRGAWTQVETLVSLAPDPSAVDREPRGIFHRQWFVLFPAAAVLGGAGLFASALGRGRMRSGARTSWALAAGSVFSLAGWVLFTHGQSRFLLPLLPGAAMIAALAPLTIAGRLRGARAGRGVGTFALALGALPLAQGVQSLSLLLRTHTQADGGCGYNLALVGGPAAVSGLPLIEAGRGGDPRALTALDRAGHVAWINGLLKPGERVYLLGDSTPAYFSRAPLYHTTWDRSPLGEAIGEHPEDPHAWAQALRARGATHVLYNPAELERLRSSGYYDTRVTPERVMRLLDTQCEPVKAWEGARVLLYRLRPGARPTGAGHAPAETRP